MGRLCIRMSFFCSIALLTALQTIIYNFVYQVGM